MVAPPGASPDAWRNGAGDVGSRVEAVWPPTPSGNICGDLLRVADQPMPRMGVDDEALEDADAGAVAACQAVDACAWFCRRV